MVGVAGGVPTSIRNSTFHFNSVSGGSLGGGGGAIFSVEPAGAALNNLTISDNTVG